MKITIFPAKKSSRQMIRYRPFIALAMIFLLTLLTACAGAGGKNSSIPAEQAKNGGQTEKTEVSGETASSVVTDSSSGSEAAAASTSDRVSSTAADQTAEAASADSGTAAGASTSAAAAGTAATAAASAAAAAPVMLDYIDAWEEWHTMEVDLSVEKNVYDPALFVEEDGVMTYAGGDQYEVLQGVDVSEHQGWIDWKAVAESGIDFAFIRVGYRGYGETGSLNEDAAAVDNLQRAKAAGLQVGTYIFSQALNEEEARAEAQLAVNVIGRAGVETDLPLIYDPEVIHDEWGRANDITRDQVALNTAAFRDEVEKMSSLEVDIYSNLPWEDMLFDSDTLNQYRIWYADYEKKPQTPYHFAWWQYTNKGIVPGIEGEVDRNLWIRER